MNPGQSGKSYMYRWLIVVVIILLLIVISMAVPGVRASMSAWLGLSVATASQVPVAPVTLEAVLASPPAAITPATAGYIPTTSEPTGVSIAPPAGLSQLSTQIGWDVLTPSYIPAGYHYQSAYFEPDQKMLVLTYLVTRPLPGTNDPTLTSSETITFLQSQKNDFVPMQIAPNTVVTDTLVNSAPAAFTIGGWDTEFIKDNLSPGGGKMVSSWRDDLPVKNLYWQVGNLYLTLITADGAVSQNELIEMASSTGK
jgi:hypothetical protein